VGKKNPDLTICQLHTAMTELIRAVWREDEAGISRVMEKVAQKITRKQARMAASRKSHTKKTQARLRKLGIKLTELARCTWGPT